MRSFDPFSAKVCTLIGTNIPRALLSRFVLIKMKPKKATENIDEAVKDDDTFGDLRRKLKRWSDDHAAALKDAPAAADFALNRERNNWNLQLAIADLAGPAWRQKALEAAELLTRSTRKPSWRRRLLMEFRIAFKRNGGKDITSADFYRQLTTDVLSVWYEYNHGTGVITQRQVAHLLSDLEIYPTDVGPSNKRVKGYRFKDFIDAFDRYDIAEPAEDPRIRALGSKRKKRVRGKK